MSDLRHDDVDLDEVRAKYAYERDRRLRKDGIKQFIEVTGDFAYFVEDPYIGEKISRDPINDVSEVIVIGGGFGGLLTGAHLRKAGFENIRFIEKAGDFGGTWYWNRYPGVQCDIDATIYLPFLEETGYMPTLKYTFGDEIHEHSIRIAKHFDLYRDVCFQTEVTKVSWLAGSQMWEVRTDKGDVMRAKYVAMANGPLHRPRLPGVPGINDFKGHSFHTTRWDYNYTGGNLHGGMNKLADKRIAIVGTGATALQCVPHLGESAQHLYVVQRTPSSVDERNNHETDPEWFASLKPGWQQDRKDNFTKMSTGVVCPEDLIQDGWADMFKRVQASVADRREKGTLEVGMLDTLIELADFGSMERIRKRVDSVVEDEKTAAMLKAYYRKNCKRAAFHDEYLKTFNRPNVTLLDTDGQGLTRVDENSIIIGEERFEIDCLIFATGFEVGTSLARRSGYDVFGRDGQALSNKFATGPQTQFGLQTRGFPNLFFLGPVHGATSINVAQTLDEQAQTVAHTIKQTRDAGGKLVEVSHAAEEAWGARVENSGVKARRAFLVNCTPGYYNGEGAKDSKGARFAHEFSAGPSTFFDILRSWRSMSHLPGLEVDGERLMPSSSDVEHLKSEAFVRTQLNQETRNRINLRDIANPPRIGTVPAAEMRERYAAACRMRGKGPELWSVEDKRIISDGLDLPLRIYRPAPEPDAIILFFHGGGGCIGSLETHDATVCRLAQKTGATIVSVDYRLAPEAPYPAANNDALSALEWVKENREKLAAPTSKMFLCGDSFGGTLAASLALVIRDSTDIEIAGQILIYPSVDGDLNNPDFDEFDPPLLKKSEIQWFRTQYAPKDEDRKQVAVSPNNAASLANLPPALILTAEFDLLAKQAGRFADRLRRDNVPTKFKVFQGTVHGFMIDGVGQPQSDEVMSDIAAFISNPSLDPKK